MNLNKRECNINIELIPYGNCFLDVIWTIGNDIYTFRVSSAVGFQFASLVEAIYKLYYEDMDPHDDHCRTRPEVSYYYPENDPSLHIDESRIQAIVKWDGEGIDYIYEIALSKVSKNQVQPKFKDEDTIDIRITHEGIRTGKYTVDGHDLCYAVAKAYTDAIKKYGIYGYAFSTGLDLGIGDTIDVHMLLFIKSYALGVMDVRKLKSVSKDGIRSYAYRTSFDQEIELLLFDM